MFHRQGGKGRVRIIDGGPEIVQHLLGENVLVRAEFFPYFDGVVVEYLECGVGHGSSFPGRGQIQIYDTYFSKVSQRKAALPDIETLVNRTPTRGGPTV